MHLLLYTIFVILCGRFFTIFAKNTTDVLLKIVIFSFLKPSRLIFTIGGKAILSGVMPLMSNFDTPGG